MKRKRTVAGSLVVGAIGAALVVGPILHVGSAQAARRPIRTYRCIGDAGDATVFTQVHNPGSTTASITHTVRDGGGVQLAPPAKFTLPPKQTIQTAYVTGAAVIEYRTRSKLIIDGHALYAFGSNPDLIRQVRCS